MKNRIRGIIVETSGLINRNTGWLIATAIVFFGLSIMTFQKQNQKLLEGVAETASNTKAIVSKQDETLRAIQKVAEDNRLISDQKTNIIICMLQVPVDQRTTDTLNDCRKTSSAEPSQASSPDFQSLNQADPTPTQEMAVTPSEPPQNPPQPMLIKTPVGTIPVCIPFTDTCIRQK